MIFVVAPACSRAFFGSVSSTCSKSSVTKMATRNPSNLFLCMSILLFNTTIVGFPILIMMAEACSSEHIEYTSWLEDWMQYVACQILHQEFPTSTGKGGMFFFRVRTKRPPEQGYDGNEQAKYGEGKGSH